MNMIIRAPLVIDLPTPLIKMYILVLYEDIPTYLAIFLTFCDFQQIINVSRVLPFGDHSLKFKE